MRVFAAVLIAVALIVGALYLLILRQSRPLGVGQQPAPASPPQPEWAVGAPLPDVYIPRPDQGRVHAQQGTVAVAATDLAEGGSVEDWRWVVSVVGEDLGVREVLSREGDAYGVWVSPDCEEVLIAWSNPATDDPDARRAVAWLDIRGDEATLIAEYSGELLQFNFFGLSPWSGDSRRWLSLSAVEGVLIRSRDGKSVALAAPRDARLHWLSDQPDHSYCVDGRRDVYLVSPSGARSVASIPPFALGGFTAIGDVVFYLSEDQNSLTRVDLLTGEKETRAVGPEVAELGTIARIGAIGGDWLWLKSFEHENEETTRVMVSGLDYATMTVTTLWSARYSREMEGMFDSAADLVYCTGSGDSVWISWSDEEVEDTRLKRVAIR